ncbi:hypothetical protein SSBR45G_21630 [Bradyrhizobium sp. SSBR45G]|nr:hypothetical protein SSBR45G_21630 [Bradyrhizobium sp. SSBR45G]GLH84013.1 hypothetical protein SSBR45R_14730 [Bradyrhizobium sp. SSBR45R]
MHDPADQPSIQPSSDPPGGNGELASVTQAASGALIQLDQSPAIEPETNPAADGRSKMSKGGRHKRPLATPTMWR